MNGLNYLLIMFIKLHVESLCNDKSYLGKKPARELARGMSLI